ncbi:MAG: NAD(P)H-binding protein [Ahrensia sp.]|nr:NAD(P)H-binding protein [Ahrensia sp.]
MKSPENKLQRVLLAGATGTIGSAVAHALVARGFNLTCVVRQGADTTHLPADARIIEVDLTQTATHGDDDFDIVISCLASRSGVKADAWAVDYRANLNLLTIANETGAGQFILLSAICVQRPKLEFQKAKLAFEEVLTKSGLSYQIVRPTAFFKSLSGQVKKVIGGKSFLVFGDGKITSCKPISDRDLANFIVDQIGNAKTFGKVLPIGGPGPAITPLDQAAHLFALIGQKPRIKHVSLKLMDAIIAILSLGAKIIPALEEKAEYARIGRYYATESMLAYDHEAGVYDADATPSYGSDTLFDHYADLVDITKAQAS